MSNFRQGKTRLTALCSAPDWKKALEKEIHSEATAKQFVNPLFSLLTRPEMRWQAAFGLGKAIAYIAEKNKEAARVLVRRLMWGMNEESGNLGWGIPEAMACALVESAAMAQEYNRILISYGHDTGREDNFIDYAPLRRGVYWGIGHLATTRFDAAAAALPHLVYALRDEDNQAAAMACWALSRMAASAPKKSFEDKATRPQWQQTAITLRTPLFGLSISPENATTFTIEVFDGEAIISLAVDALQQHTSALVGKNLQDSTASPLAQQS